MYPNMDLQARAIMHFAATPIDFSQNASFGGIKAIRPIPFHLQSASNRTGLLPPTAMISQFMQTGRV